MKPGRPLSKHIRDQLRRDYLLGGFTNEDLAKRYDVHPNTIYNLAQRESWDDLRTLISLENNLYAVAEHLCQVIKNGPPSRPVEKEDLQTTEDEETLNWSF